MARDSGVSPDLGSSRLVNHAGRRGHRQVVTARDGPGCKSHMLLTTLDA